MARKCIDCREFPSDSACSLKISGEEEEVIRAAAAHAVDVHGEEDTAELRSMIRSALHDDYEMGAGASAHP